MGNVEPANYAATRIDRTVAVSLWLREHEIFRCYEGSVVCCIPTLAVCVNRPAVRISI